jgi:hypothetical protein
MTQIILWEIPFTRHNQMCCVEKSGTVLLEGDSSVALAVLGDAAATSAALY